MTTINNVLAKVCKQVERLESRISPLTLEMERNIPRQSLEQIAEDGLFEIVTGKGRKRKVRVPIHSDKETVKIKENGVVLTIPKIIGYDMDECETEIVSSLSRVLTFRNNGQGYYKAKQTRQQNGLPSRVSLPDTIRPELNSNEPGSKDRLAKMAEFYQNLPEDSEDSVFNVSDSDIADYMVMICMEADKTKKLLFQNNSRERED